MDSNATASPSDDSERIFYDGDCGVCHWSVRFVAERDPQGTTFRFAPLGGEVFAAQIPTAEQQRLPDSIVVQTATGERLTESTAVLYILRRLGGRWRFLGWFLRWVPRFLRDAAYRRFAAVRHRLAAKPTTGACPLPSPALRGRLDP